MNPDGPHDLARFVRAQEPVYQDVVSELKKGQKRSHWMWFIFAQIDGLGFSDTARRYAIKNAAEARGYLKHPILGSRLVECSRLVQAIKDLPVSQIFGSPDDMKFRSCMTLFASVAEKGSVFQELIDERFAGEPDQRTIEILERLQKW